MRSGSWISAAIGTAATAAVLALLLVAVGRPVATDDAWWHLALGREFAREGPWLEGDPLLFGAAQPASAAPWLSDVVLAGILDHAGFAGLRAAHVACAAAILALAAVLLRRAGASVAVLAPALIAFATLAAYRLFQLKPDLATLLATMLLALFVLLPRAGPTPARTALCAAGMALWANLHPGFLLGPILLAAALAGVVGASAVAGFAPGDRMRIRRLALCLVAGSVATLANPNGVAAALPYFASGSESPELAAIRDDWARLDLFSPPAAAPPPTLADWLLVWALLLGTAAASAVAFAGWRKRAADAIDPALVALAWAALAAAIVAVRFLWLGIFPLLLMAALISACSPPVRARVSLASGPLALALLAAFVWIGPWPRISDVLGRESYRQPYSAAKYPVDPVWLMRDAGLEGRLFTEYWYGGYAGFWLAPKVTTLVNGSLNVTPDTLAAYNAIARRQGVAGGESFLALLDRLGIDLFLGTGMPLELPAPYTVAYLERAPGWTLVFRNAKSALYLRNQPGRAANLERAAAYYAREGIPFDPERGFEPGRVVREHPSWAIEHQLIPEDFAVLERDAAGSLDARTRVEALVRSSAYYALLGLYDEALEREAVLRRIRPMAAAPVRRSVWCLLRAGRSEQARSEAASLDGGAKQDPLVAPTVALALALPSLSDDEAASRVARLPLLTPTQAQALASRLASPRARVR